MSRARVDQIVNQLGTGPVEFSEGLVVPSNKTLTVGGPVTLYGGVQGTAGQIIKAGVNSELVWSNPDAVSIAAQDGASSDRKVLRITTAGSANTTSVVLRAGNNVTLTRATDEIRIDSTYVNDDTITRLQASGGTLVSGDIVFTAGGSSTVSQTGNTINYTSTNTTYTGGTGITLTGTEFSLPQAVATTSTPTFGALTVTNALTVGSINCSGDITNASWAGDVITVDKGGTGSTTATSAFLSLAPTVTTQNNKFLKTDGTTIFWSDLPSSGGFTPTTYDLTAEDGPNAQSAKLRITDSDGNYDDVILTASDHITIARVGNTVTVGSSLSDTQLSTEQVQDIVGGMIDNAQNTNITVTYDDNSGKLTYEGSAGGGGADGNHTYDLDSSSVTNGAAIRLIPGGSGTGETIDSVNLIGGSNVTITRDVSNGDVTIQAADTDTNTVTRLQVSGPGTSGGALAAGDFSIQASGAISLAQSGTTIAIGSTDTNSYVNTGYYDAVNGKLFLERTDSLSDVQVPVTNLQAYFDTRYATTAGLTDARITSATFSSATGNLTLGANDGTANIVVSLDGRYAQSEGPNTYVSSSGWGDPVTTPPGYHTGRKVLVLTRNDQTTMTVETEPLLDYLDTIYAPITSSDTRVDEFTFTNGSLFLGVSNGDEYTHNLDNRYIKQNDFVDSATWDSGNGKLTLGFGHNTPAGTTGDKADIVVDLDGRYKLADAQDVAIQSISWNQSTGNLQATKNNSTTTTNTNLDGRYFDTLSMSGNTVTMIRTGGTNASFSFPAPHVYIPEGSKLMFCQASAPCGWVKETTHNDKAVRIVSGGTGGQGFGGSNFSSTFVSNIGTGGSVTSGDLGVSANSSSWATSWPSGTDISVSNLTLGGVNNVTGSFSSGAYAATSQKSVSGQVTGTSSLSGNISGNASLNGKSTGNHGISGSQGALHWHNYYRPGSYGTARWDDGSVVRGEQGHTTSGAGGGNGHSHNLSGNASVSGNCSGSASINLTSNNMKVQGNSSLSGSVSINYNTAPSIGGSLSLPSAPSVTPGSMSINGSPSFTSGSISMNVKYVDVIICRKDTSNATPCP